MDANTDGYFKTRQKLSAQCPTLRWAEKNQVEPPRGGPVARCMVSQGIKTFHFVICMAVPWLILSVNLGPLFSKIRKKPRSGHEWQKRKKESLGFFLSNQWSCIWWGLQSPSGRHTPSSHKTHVCLCTNHFTSSFRGLISFTLEFSISIHLNSKSKVCSQNIRK